MNQIQMWQQHVTLHDDEQTYPMVLFVETPMSSDDGGSWHLAADLPDRRRTEADAIRRLSYYAPLTLGGYREIVERASAWRRDWGVIDTASLPAYEAVEAACARVSDTPNDPSRDMVILAVRQCVRGETPWAKLIGGGRQAGAFAFDFSTDLTSWTE